MWFAGNLDPAVFDSPLTFDIAREPRVLRKHLSFGHGLHTCIGGPLARMEGKVVVEEFMKRFDGLERAGPEVPYPYPTLNGPYKLPVRLIAKQA
jgi:cytochrome P450